ncbi:hypothetical protein [Embleya sp. AB8]|uniref:hypothetical protein n=1 Tax=Embleya sp. AB8 TaxID=3156304 RepID=UPI003C739FD2
MRRILLPVSAVGSIVLILAAVGACGPAEEAPGGPPASVTMTVPPTPGVATTPTPAAPVAPSPAAPATTLPPSHAMLSR